MPRLPNWTRLAAFALAVGTAAACSEQIESGAACPELCPTENVPVRDTVLEAVVLDSVIDGYPFPGDPPYVLLSARPRADTLDVRGIFRFDTVPGKYFPANASDSVAITRADSTYLTIHYDTASKVIPAGTRITAYDVGFPAGNDTATATLTPQFTPARVIGSILLDSATLARDSIRIRLLPTLIPDLAAGTRRLRVGLQITSPSYSRLRILASRGGASLSAARISFDPVSPGDTTYAPIVVSLNSTTPAGSEFAPALRDFTIVSAGAVPTLAPDLVVGGLPARRALLRFAVPSRFIDSSTIVRATLQLVQRPAAGAERVDTVQLESDIVLADQSITDLRRAADLSAPRSAFAVDSLRLSPADSGTRVLSLINVVRAWRNLPASTQRALVFRAGFEGSQTSALRFFSREAPPALRPRLRLSYIPRTEFALP